MSDIKFGLAQLTKPTPATVARAAKIYVTISGLFLCYLPTFTFIADSKAKVISQIIGFSIAAVISTAQMFGVQINNSSVPAKDVTAIETN